VWPTQRAFLKNGPVVLENRRAISILVEIQTLIYMGTYLLISFDFYKDKNIKMWANFKNDRFIIDPNQKSI